MLPVDRYLLSRFDEGGVLVDLETGAFFRVNDVGMLVFGAAARGGAPAATQALSARYGLPAERAAADVAAFLDGLTRRIPTTGRNPVSFRPEAAGFTLLHAGRPQLWLAADGTAVELRTEPARSIDVVDRGAQDGSAGRGGGALLRDARSIDHEQLLLWAAPHLLALQGRHVLHASAVRRAGRVVAFLGGSGAGKTTTARAAGDVVAEDLVLLTPDDRVVTGGEAALRAWVAAQAGEVASDARTLADAYAGETLPLGRVLVLDAARRGGDRVVEAPLAGPEAMLTLLENGFAELAEVGVWRQVVVLCERLARTVEIAAATVPAGLDALAHSLISMR